jgi:hypothetical protein
MVTLQLVSYNVLYAFIGSMNNSFMFFISNYIIKRKKKDVQIGIAFWIAT